MTNSMTTSRFNPMTSASNAMNKIEEAAFEKERRKLEALKACKAIRAEYRTLQQALLNARLELDVLVSVLSEDSD